MSMFDRLLGRRSGSKWNPKLLVVKQSNDLPTDEDIKEVFSRIGQTGFRPAPNAFLAGFV